jgi:Flp pilus assembly protein TadD
MREMKTASLSHRWVTLAWIIGFLVLAGLLQHLGIAHNDLGLKDKAIDYFQIALRLNPDDADTHNNMGIICAEGGMMGEAAQQFEAAVRLNPADPTYRYDAAKAYTPLGMSGKAEEEFRKAGALGKKHVD